MVRLILNIFVIVNLCVHAAEGFSGDTLIFSMVNTPSIEITNPIHAKLKTAYTKIGVKKIELMKFPAKRSLLQANQGKVDGELYRISGMEIKHKNLIKIKEPVFSFSGGYVTYKKRLAFDKAKKQKHLVVGGVRGIMWEDDAFTSLEKLKFNSYRDALKVLKKGRLDVVLLDDYNFRNFSKEMKEGLYFTRLPNAKIHLYHYLHKKNAHLVDKLTNAIRVLNKKK